MNALALIAALRAAANRWQGGRCPPADLIFGRRAGERWVFAQLGWCEDGGVLTGPSWEGYGATEGAALVALAAAFVGSIAGTLPTTDEPWSQVENEALRAAVRAVDAARADLRFELENPAPPA